MDFPAQLLPDWLLWLSALIYIPALRQALYVLAALSGALLLWGLGLLL